jgi:hypothetical protein
MILMNFIKNSWRMGGGLSAVVIAVMIKSMLIQRLKNLMTDTMVPKTGNGSLCLRLVRIENIHALLRVGNHVAHMHLLYHAHVPLRKKGQWVDGVCFVFEGSDSVSGKVSI